RRPASPAAPHTLSPGRRTGRGSPVVLAIPAVVVDHSGEALTRADARLPPEALTDLAEVGKDATDVDPFAIGRERPLPQRSGAGDVEEELGELADGEGLGMAEVE